MSITDKFGSAVGNMSLENSEKARKLLLTGYRLQEKRLLTLPGQGTSRIRTVCGKTGYAENYPSTGKAGKCCYGQYFCAG